AALKAHLRNPPWSIRQESQSVNQRLGVTRSDHNPATVLLDQPGNFPILIANDDDGFAGGGDPIEFARYNQSLKLWIERQPVRVGDRQGIWQHFLLLIRDEGERAGKTLSLDCLRKLLEPFAAADHQKNKMRLIAQAFGGCEHSLKLMRSAQIARITKDELADQAPALTQWVFRLCNWPDDFVITPIGDDMNTLGWSAQ